MCVRGRSILVFLSFSLRKGRKMLQRRSARFCSASSGLSLMRSFSLSSASSLHLGSWYSSRGPQYLTSIILVSPASSATLPGVRTKTYDNVGDPACWYDDEKENLGGRWPFGDYPEELRVRKIPQRPKRASRFPRIPEPRSKQSLSFVIFDKKNPKKKKKQPAPCVTQRLTLQSSDISDGETVASFLAKLKNVKRAKAPASYKDWDKLESKFKSWEHFFSCKREEMKALGIKSCQVRKYLLGWMEKYRQGVDPGT